MSFLSPLFLIGLLAAALPIILHFTLRGRAPRLSFSHVRFLERAFVHRDRRRRLRELILLALRVAAIVLLAVAFARPFLNATDDATEALAADAIDQVANDAAPVVAVEPGTVEPTGVLVVVNGGTVEPEAFYLARAMDAAPPEQPFAVRAVPPDAVASVDPESWGMTDVVVVVGTTGLSRPGRARIAQFVASGGGLLLAAGPGVDPSLVGDLLGPSAELTMSPPEEGATRRLAVAHSRHAIFRPFGDRTASLGQAQFAGAARLALPSSEVLARFDDGDPALLEYTDGPGRALVFGSDLNDAWNDFPRRPGYVPFVHEALRYLAPRSLDSPLPDETEAPAAPPTDVEQDTEQALWWYVVVALALVLVGELFVGRTMV